VWTLFRMELAGRAPLGLYRPLRRSLTQRGADRIADDSMAPRLIDASKLMSLIQHKFVEGQACGLPGK